MKPKCHVTIPECLKSSIVPACTLAVY